MSHKPRWTTKEISILENEWLTTPKTKLLKLFPRRTWYAIKNKASRLNLHRLPFHPLPPPLSRLPNIELTEIEKAQTAMMIDCDGHITMRRGARFSPSVGFTNTDKRLVKKFKELTRSDNKISDYRSKESWKVRYSFEISAMPLIYCILTQCIPYFVIKMRQAKALLEFIEIQDRKTQACVRESLNRSILTNYSDRQIELFQQIRKLNSKGV